MDVLSPRDSLFDDLLEDAHRVAGPVRIETHDRRPGRGPIFSAETLLDARSAWEAALEDARPVVRR